MFFWVSVFIIVLLGMLLSAFLTNSDKKYYFAILVFFILFISVFRNNIGLDYYEYQKYFEYVNFDLNNIQLDPFFSFICEFLRTSGFNSQAMFAVYALLTTHFFYKGCLYYGKSCWWIGIVFFTVYGVNNLFWFSSLNLVRQFLSIAIVFYASKYVFERKYTKFLVSVGIAMLCHYTAIVALVYCLLKKLNVTKKTMIFILAFSLILANFNVFSAFLAFIAESFGNILGDYRYYFTDRYVRKSFLEGGSGLGVFMELIPYLTAIFIANLQNKEQRFWCNSLFFGLLLWILFGFFPPMLRMRIYFFIFVPLIYAYNLKINAIIWSYKNFLVLFSIVIMCFMSLYNISLFDKLEVSKNSYHNTNYNIEYKFTVDFLK